MSLGASLGEELPDLGGDKALLKALPPRGWSSTQRSRGQDREDGERSQPISLLQREHRWLS